MSANSWPMIFFRALQLLKKEQQSLQRKLFIPWPQTRKTLQKKKTKVRLSLTVSLEVQSTKISLSLVEQDNKNRRVDRFPHVDKKHYAKVNKIM